LMDDETREQIANELRDAFWGAIAPLARSSRFTDR
jgi:hypothetical protein